ncbi:MAG: hypothetical protein RLZZ76_729 [Candidatus Parcubacteria bacterium]|jgi:NAD(P)H-flavin reductase
MHIGDSTIRRAFSISSSVKEQTSITLSIRESKQGQLSPIFWKQDCSGLQVEVMGPLGLNTVDKMHSNTIYLFAYGVGAGVVKSLLDYCVSDPNYTHIVVMTGSRSEDEILHKEYFDGVAKKHSHVEVRHVVSQPATKGIFREGYIQDHLGGLDFSNADVYACGQEVACNSLTERIKEQNPTSCNFFIEAFH